MERGPVLANGFFLQSDGTSAAWRATGSVAEEANVDFEFGESAAEGVAVHAEFAGGAALVAFVFLENRQDEALFEFADSLGIKDVALVHLHDEGF
jgi:hypothetical protein